MSGTARMVIDDPSKMHLLTADMKKQIIKGAIKTVNIMAGKARKEAVKNLEKNFNTRNAFTKKQIQFTPMAESSYIKLSAIQSTVGVTVKAAYMVRQEEGGKHTPIQGKSLAIATDTARGGSFGNAVQKDKLLNSLITKNKIVTGKSSKSLDEPQTVTYSRGQSKRRPEIEKKGHYIKTTSHTKKSNFVSRAYVAHKHGLYMWMGGKKNGSTRNLHCVTGFKAKGTGSKKSPRKIEFKTEMIYNFQHKETVTKSKPWFLPACEKVAKDRGKIFIGEMKKLGM